jgi:hypothetical protein
MRLGVQLESFKRCKQKDKTISQDVHVYLIPYLACSPCFCFPHKDPDLEKC